MRLTLVAEEDGQQLVNANRSGHFLRLSKIAVTMNSHRFRSCLPAIVRGRNVRSKLHLAPDDDVVRNTAAKYICHHWHSLNIDHHLRRLNDTRHFCDRTSGSINVSTSTASLLLLFLLFALSLRWSALCFSTKHPYFSIRRSSHSKSSL